ncbi:MAG: hypothetical protein KAI24_13530, partial [Planctomycetes bacterium]|nr:hypothetical protein [Planctomycetota bacterium]
MAESRLSLSSAVPAIVLLVGGMVVTLFTWHNVSRALTDMESTERRLVRISGLNTAAALEAALRR